jgi:hypothetical protein
MVGSEGKRGHLRAGATKPNSQCYGSAAHPSITVSHLHYSFSAERRIRLPFWDSSDHLTGLCEADDASGQHEVDLCSAVDRMAVGTMS